GRVAQGGVPGKRRRADEAWPHGPYAYLPRGGIAITARPGPAARRGGRPDRSSRSPRGRTMPEQVRCSVTAGPVRRAAAPGQTAIRRHCGRETRPEEEGRAPTGRDLYP